MTILQKDLAEEWYYPDYNGSNGSSGYTSTSESYYSGTVAGTGGMPDPGWASGSNDETSGTTRGIYLASNFQMSLAIQALFPDLSQSGILASAGQIKLKNLAKGSPAGTPLYTFSDESYLALWMGAFGIGYYVFVGYTAGSGPTQTLYFNSATQSFSAVPPQSITQRYAWAGWNPPESDSETPTQEESDADALHDAITGGPISYEMATGYDRYGSTDEDSGLPTRIVASTPGTPYFFTPVSTSTTQIVAITTMPATTASGGDRVVSTAVRRMVTNKGWNSWARSIEPLEKGQYLIFTAASGISGAHLAISTSGRESHAVGSHRHAITIDSSGVKVYENGTVVKTLKSTQSSTSQIRIYRHLDNTIHFTITTGTETVVYRSLNTNAFSAGAVLYIYANLYTSGDKLLSASFNAGEIKYMSV